MHTLKRFLRFCRLVPKSNPLFVRVYRDKVHQWRWQFTRSGKIIGDSAESYHNAADVNSTLEATFDAIRSGNVVIENQ